MLEAMAALFELKREGVVRAVGFSGERARCLMHFLDRIGADVTPLIARLPFAYNVEARTAGCSQA